MGQEDFAALIKTVVYKNPILDVLAEEVADDFALQGQTFAKRLITGQAAEQYFRLKHRDFAEFEGCEIEDTTKLGCGFDFKLSSSREYFGVEVKGLNESNGSVSLTHKEYAVASHLQDRYFLFVVKNFKEKPSHDIYRNPLSSSLTFKRVERAIVQLSWRTSV